MSQERTYKGIVLRKGESGETDRRLTLLTEGAGKIEVTAKGARKGGSRLAGSTEVLNLAVFTIAEGKKRRFVTQVQPITSFPKLRETYETTLAGLAMAELWDAVMPWDIPEDGHWELLIQTLHLLELHPKWFCVTLWAGSRLMQMEGHAPDWEACHETGLSEREDPCWLSVSAGGRVHSSLHHEWADAVPVPPLLLRTLNALQELDEPPSNIVLSREVMRVQIEFWQKVVEKQLKAGEALASLLLSQS